MFFMGQGILIQPQILRMYGQLIHFAENFRSQIFHPVAVQIHDPELP
jgi:hypothetical protein